MANKTAPYWPDWRLDIEGIPVDNTAVLTIRTRFNPEQQAEVQAAVERLSNG